MIAKSIIELLQNPLAGARMSQGLKAAKDSLGQPGAAERAAKLILEIMK